MDKLLIILLALGLSLPGLPEPLINDVIDPLGGACPVYLIGSTAVAIVLPESSGNSENWTANEVQQVHNEVEDGAAWWAGREPLANVSYQHEYYLIETEYEPIQMPETDSTIWIKDVMATMGYDYPTAREATERFNQDMRTRQGTDWAFTVFVVDSSNDPDGKFTDGSFAFVRSFCGPYLVMTYDNDGYGIRRMDMVMAHEMGHMFGAQDQYHDAHIPCDRRSGYLQIETQNSDYGDCLLSVPSIMKFPPSAYPWGLVDKYARGQVGWWDYDMDGILDPVDPEVTEPYRLFLPIIIN